MKRIVLFIAFVLAAASAVAQTPSYGQPTVTLFVNTAPTGTCSAGIPNEQAISTGVMYSCQNVVNGVGTWAVLPAPPGTGNVTGPSSSTANYLTGFSDATGKVIKSLQPSPSIDTSSGVSRVRLVVYLLLQAATIATAIRSLLESVLLLIRTPIAP